MLTWNPNNNYKEVEFQGPRIYMNPTDGTRHHGQDDGIWESEQMDQYKKFHFVKRNPQGNTQYHGIPVGVLDEESEGDLTTENGPNEPLNTDKMTEYDDNTCTKDITHYNQLLAELKKNEFDNTADDYTKAKERGKIANLFRTGLLDWPENEEDAKKLLNDVQDAPDGETDEEDAEEEGEEE